MPSSTPIAFRLLFGIFKVSFRKGRGTANAHHLIFVDFALTILKNCLSSLEISRFFMTLLFTFGVCHIGIILMHPVKHYFQTGIVYWFFHNKVATGNGWSSCIFHCNFVKTNQFFPNRIDKGPSMHQPSILIGIRSTIYMKSSSVVLMHSYNCRKSKGQLGHITQCDIRCNNFQIISLHDFI